MARVTVYVLAFHLMYNLAASHKRTLLAGRKPSELNESLGFKSFMHIHWQDARTQRHGSGHERLPTTFVHGQAPARVEVLAMGPTEPVIHFAEACYGKGSYLNRFPCRIALHSTLNYETPDASTGGWTAVDDRA